MTRCHVPLDGIEAWQCPPSNHLYAYWGEYPPNHVGQYPVDRERPTCFYVYDRFGLSSGAAQVDLVSTRQHECWTRIYGGRNAEQGGIYYGTEQQQRSCLRSF